jgi:hypothetical protein
MAALDPPPEIGSSPLGHASFEEEAYGPVPEGEDFFLAVPMEPTRAGDGQAEGREEVDSFSDSSLALLQPGGSGEMEAAPHQRRGGGTIPWDCHRRVGGLLLSTYGRGSKEGVSRQAHAVVSPGFSEAGVTGSPRH